MKIKTTRKGESEKKLGRIISNFLQILPVSRLLLLVLSFEGHEEEHSETTLISCPILYNFIIFPHLSSFFLHTVPLVLTFLQSKQNWGLCFLQTQNLSCEDQVTCPKSYTVYTGLVLRQELISSFLLFIAYCTMPQIIQFIRDQN